MYLKDVKKQAIMAMNQVENILLERAIRDLENQAKARGIPHVNFRLNWTGDPTFIPCGDGRITVGQRCPQTREWKPDERYDPADCYNLMRSGESLVDTYYRLKREGTHELYNL